MPNKKRRLDPYEGFLVQRSPSRPPTRLQPLTESLSHPPTVVLPSGSASSWPRSHDTHAGPQNAQAGPSRLRAKEPIKTPLYNFSGLSGFTPPIPYATPSKALASISSVSPFPFTPDTPIPISRSLSEIPVSSTRLRPISYIRPESPFGTAAKNEDQGLSSCKPLKRLLELNPILVDEIEDSEDEGSGDAAGEIIYDEKEEGGVKSRGSTRGKEFRYFSVEESPSKPGPAVRNGEPSLAARLSNLLIRQDASLSMFRTNLLLSTTPKSTGTGRRHGAGGTSQTGIPSAALQCSILDSADAVVNVMEVILPIQHGCPVFRARLTRSDGSLARELLESEHGGASPAIKTPPDLNSYAGHNPFLTEAKVRNPPAHLPRPRDAKPYEIFLSLLPLSNISTAGPQSPDTLGLDPRVLADGLRVYRLARKGDAALVGGRGAIQVGIWKPYHLVSLEGARFRGSDHASPTIAGADNVGGDVRQQTVIMCSRYVIMEERE